MRSSDRDFARFVAIALGSLAELEFQLQIAHRLGFLADSGPASLARKIVSLRRQISALRRSLLVGSQAVRRGAQGREPEAGSR